jgi:hypothetical protein
VYRQYNTANTITMHARLFQELALLLLGIHLQPVLATQLTPLQLSHGYSRAAGFGGLFDTTLNVAADDCGVGYKQCGSGCIPDLGTCCEGEKGWCPTSSVCVDDKGCCDIGKVCTEKPGDCLGNLVACGNDGHCIPPGKICCSNTGYYCDPGEICRFEGFNYCEKGDSEGGSSTQTTKTTGGQTSSTSRAGSTSTGTSADRTTSSLSTTATGDDTTVADATKSTGSEGPASTTESSDSGVGMAVESLGRFSLAVSVGLMAAQMMW